MSTRYILNTLSLVAGVVLLVFSRSFSGGALEWTGFGLSAAVVVAAVAGLVLATAAKHVVGFGVLGVVGAWSAVAALVFTGSTLGWLALADGIAIAVVALGALGIHEVTTERVVHTIEVHDDSRELETV